MSFLKFKEGSEDKDLHWHRADRDGAPFRGNKLPILREEEFEAYAERVHNAKQGTFDTSKPDQVQCGRTYQQVLDGCLANWFKPLCARQFQWVKRKGEPPVMYVYIEWSEPEMQMPESVIKQLSTTVTPIESETRYGQSQRSSKSQPRALRPAPEVGQ